MSQEGKLVFIIEDDEDINSLLKFILEKNGYTVRQATDGQSAFALLELPEVAHVIILDLMLPYYDGYEIIEKIKSQDGYHDVPIIVLTAKSREQDITRALELGADDYLVKPFQMAELVARLQRLLK